MSLEVVIDYQPHPKQLLIHEDTHKYKVIVCGRRFGKSTAATNHIIMEALTKPGKYWFISPERGQGKENVWGMFLKYSPKKAIRKISNAELKIYFKNGSEIRLTGAKNAAALVGSKIRGVVFDEFSDQEPSVWWEKIEPTMNDYADSWAWFIGTPKGKNHFYELFIRCKDHKDDGYVNENNEPILPDENWQSWQFKTIDNEAMPTIQAEAKRKKGILAESYYLEQYEASFEDFTGRIYKEYTEKNRIKCPAIKPGQPIFCGIDTGRFTAFSFITVDVMGKAYVFDELVTHDRTAHDNSDLVKKILEKHQINFAQVHWIIDSASQVKREYEAEGFILLDSTKDVFNSINKLRNWFKTGKVVFDRENCPVHDAEHTTYQWDKKKGKNNKPRPVKEHDHTVNAVQYVFNSPFFYEPQDRKKKKTLEAFKDKS